MPADGYLNFNTKIDTDGFSDGMKDVEHHAKSFGSALDGLGKKIKTAFNIAAIAAFGKALIDASADVKAAGSQFEQTFGEMQDAAEAAIDRVAEPADILAERLRGSATSIYAFAKTAKMESTTALRFMEDALTVAADSAAYYDRSIEKTTATLQSFLKGNYENDAALGLSATETTRNAKAMELYGRKFADLTEAQKQLTLLEMVKDANRLSGAMGQAAREADGWANVTGNLSEVWHQFLGVIGQPVLALAVPVVQHMTAALEQMTTWANAAYTALAKVFGWERKQAKPIEQAADAQGQATEAVEETEEAQEGALASFDEIEILASGAAEATEQTADAAQDTAGADLEAIETSEREVDTGWVDTFVSKLQELKDFIDTTLKPSIDTIAEPFKAAFDKIMEYIDTVVKPKLNELTQKRTVEVEITMTGGETESDEKSDEDEPNVKNPFTAIGDWIANDLPTMFQNVVNTMLNMLDPLAQWFNTDLPEFIRAGINFASTVISGLLDTFTTVFNDVWTLVIDPFFMSFAENILPTFTELGTQLFNTLTVAFEEVKKAFDMVWNDAIKPVLEFIGNAWSDLWTLIQEKWRQWGEPIFNQIREAFRNIGDIFEEVWINTLKPIWDQFMSTINMLWQEHLMPLFDTIMNFVGTLVETALIVYNQVILPMISWIAAELGPAITATFTTAIDLVGRFGALVIDMAESIIDHFTNVLDFLTDVFEGDWEGAWAAVKEIFVSYWEDTVAIFKGLVNVVVGYLNGLISSFESAINTIVEKINALINAINRVLSWVGLPTIDFRIPKVTLPRIPALAEGAVIPPNREFLAVLGDQKQGVNIETPLDTMLEAFRTALAESGGRRRSQTVILMLNKRELGRAVIEAGDEEEHRIGVRLVNA